jgi:hypothetical protein
MEFKLPELALFASNVRYNPALGIAVNQLLNTRSEVEYQEALETATKIAIGYENVQLYNRKNYGVSSNLSGMPLFMPLKFQSTDGLPELLLESAVVEVNRTKNIVSTVIQGRDTSVDEFINNGDWNISVSGMLCENEPKYPLEQLKAFQRYMELNKSIKIEHEAMNALGIFEIVVLSEQPISKTPHINVQTYSFTAKSTKPLPLIIQDKSTLKVY